MASPERMPAKEDRFKSDSIPDLKPPELSPVRLPAYLNVIHPRVLRPPAAICNHLLHIGLITLEDPLHPTVRGVPYPPRNPTIPGHLFNGVPEADSLDPAAYPDVNPDLRHRRPFPPSRPPLEISFEPSPQPPLFLLRFHYFRQGGFPHERPNPDPSVWNTSLSLEPRSSTVTG